MLFQNDIPIDVAYHRYTLNMQVSSGTNNNSSPNAREPSYTTVTVSFNGVLLVVRVPGALHIKVRRELDCKLNLDSSENITQEHCCGVHNACSLLQVNRRRHSTPYIERKNGRLLYILPPIQYCDSVVVVVVANVPPVRSSQNEAHEIHRGKGLEVRLSLA
ncbi:uncharacterized protein TNCV_2996601 [Trichonephila clavipes]|nr:uncharacterized protein TNCV_2996601 [Trichonephila clavipes]